MGERDRREAMSRRDFVLQGAVGAAGLAAAGLLGTVPQALAQEATTPRRRPNVVFIITDDQNANTLGCFGGQVLTPNIDRLAREGVLFSRNYTTSAICTPSRYITLTGEYASRCEAPAFMNNNPAGQQSQVMFNT
ncbi:sulfatase-like hydrolase/transferase, partial [bacterium]|nr:sulfatase-like hydrolase/transferase [bacterium]